MLRTYQHSCTLKSHTHLTNYSQCKNFYKCNNYKYIKHNLIFKVGFHFRLPVSLNVLLHKSQWYWRSPLCKILWNYTCSTRLIVSLHTSQGYVPSGYLLHWMCHYTHHRNMEIPQYLHTDVISNVLLTWMFHYTHQRFVDSMHYVNSMYMLMYLQATCVTEFYYTLQRYGRSTVCTNWCTCRCSRLLKLFLQTHHKDMDTPQYVHYVRLLALLNV